MLNPLSSTNTRRRGSSSRGARSFRNGARRFSLRSLATSVFFVGDLMTSEDPVHRLETHPQARSFFEYPGMLDQRRVSMLVQLLQELLFVNRCQACRTPRRSSDLMQRPQTLLFQSWFHSDKCSRATRLTILFAA